MKAWEISCLLPEFPLARKAAVVRTWIRDGLDWVKLMFNGWASAQRSQYKGGRPTPTHHPFIIHHKHVSAVPEDTVISCSEKWIENTSILHKQLILFHTTWAFCLNTACMLYYNLVIIGYNHIYYYYYEFSETAERMDMSPGNYSLEMSAQWIFLQGKFNKILFVHCF